MSDRSRFPMRRTAVLITAIVFAGGAFCYWRAVQATYHGPPVTTEREDLPSGTSSLVVPVTISLDDLQAKLNEQVPTRLHAVDEDRDACVPATWIDKCILPKLFKSGCAQRLKTKVTPEIDCHVDGAVDRGAIAVAGQGDRIAITLPVSANITVRGRGEVGKHIQESANGSVTAAATVKAEIGGDWNPTATVDADYTWNDRIGVDVLGFRITFASKVDPKIREAIESFKAKIPALLAKVDVRAMAERGWRAAHAVVQVGSAPDIWLRIAPRSVGFDGLRIEGRNLTTNIMLTGDAATFVGERPAAAEPLPLPALQKSLPGPGFAFSVPVTVDFPALAALAEKALKVGTRRDIEVPKVGKVAVTFRTVTVHQTAARRLAVGVTLDADAPSALFDTRGTIWLTAAVTFDNQRKRVSLAEFDIFSSTDNAPVDLLAAILRTDPVNAILRESLEYDFTALHAAALAKAGKAMTRQLSADAYVVGSVRSLDAERMVVGPDALVLLLSAKGTAEVRSGKLAAN